MCNQNISSLFKELLKSPLMQTEKKIYQGYIFLLFWINDSWLNCVLPFIFLQIQAVRCYNTRVLIPATVCSLTFTVFLTLN